MKLNEEVKNLVENEVKKSLKEVLKAKGLYQDSKTTLKETATKKTAAVKNFIKEAIVMIPRAFLMKTEKLSDRTKEEHAALYKDAIEAFNKLSIGLDAANTEDAKSSTSSFRSLKTDETSNFNSVKLHELYFTNISDVASVISVDSLPFMRLSRDFGTFEKWQYDFIACAMSARNGWALTVFEPYRNVYMNVVLDGHDQGLPLGAIPIIAMDMFEHAYFKDYGTDKKSYVANMMRELNWNVVEARMNVAEDAKLDMLFKIQPVTNGVPENMLNAAASQADGQPPIRDIQPASPQGPQTHLSPTNPPAPAMTPGFEKPRG